MAIYIALGSNLGDKKNNMKEALQRLAKKGGFSECGCGNKNRLFSHGTSPGFITD